MRFLIAFAAALVMFSILSTPAEAGPLCRIARGIGRGAARVVGVQRRQARRANGGGLFRGLRGCN